VRLMEIVVKEALNVNIVDPNINIIEREIKKELRKAGKRFLRETLKKMEQKILSLEKTRMCECGGRKESRGRVYRNIKSLVGEIEYKRVKLRCRDCGKASFPLDEQINLKPDKNATLGLIEQSLSLGVETAYDKASEIQEKLTGMYVSGRQIQNWAKSEGEKVKEKIEKDRSEIFDNAGIPKVEEKRKRVFVQVDGTFVKEREHDRGIECKVGAIYSKKIKESKDRFKILDKRTYASTESIDTFCENFIAECNRWGVWEADEILFVGDGASWIEKMGRDYFPESVYLLDFWHLAKNIAKALGKEHRRAAENWTKEVKKTCEAKQLLRRIKSIYPHIRDPDRKEKIRNLYKYVNNNRKGIENWRKVNCLGASGVIEKTVDLTVCRRFKKRGMSWLTKGLTGLLALRLLKLNGEWNKYWREQGVPV